MSRGKYAKRAQNRRNWEELERRAAEAEQRAEKLAVQLQMRTEKTAKEITGLRRQLASLARQRDEAAAPAITSLEDQNRRLRKERDDASAKAQDSYKRYERTWMQFQRALMALGFSQVEAIEIAAATTTSIEDNFVLTSEESGVSRAAKRLPAKAVRRIQTANGHRRNDQLKDELIASLKASEDAR